MTKGWHGDRIRHGLASRGVKTSFNPNVVQYKGNIYLESDGILYRPRREFVNSVNGKLRSLSAFGFTEEDKLRMTQESLQRQEEITERYKKGDIPHSADETQNQIVPESSQNIDNLFYETSTPPAQPQDNNQSYYQNQEHEAKMKELAEKEKYAKYKEDEKEAKKKLREAEAKAGVGVGGATKMVTDVGKALWKGFKDFVSIEPNQITPPTSTGLGSNPNTNLGKNVNRRITDTNRPSDPNKMNDVTKDMYKSIDSDSIIATVENKEKLIAFANDLEHDINLLDVSFKKSQDDFQTEERKDSKVVANEIRKAKDELREEIQLVKTSGQPKKDIQYEINNLKIGYENEVDKLKDALKHQKLQNRADLKYIDDLKDDLAKLHNQTDDRIKMMVASGHRK